MTEKTSLGSSVERVAAHLRAAGHPHAPLMLEKACRSAQEAADVLGVQLGQIAKSIVFKRVADGASVLVVCSGDRRVNEAKVSAQVGELARADAAFVRERSGFAIGGVAPVAHLQPGVLLLDETLWRFGTVWAAAGHPNAVFASSPQQLLGLIGLVAAADVVETP